MRIAKLEDGTLVQIVKTSESVAFSSEKGWILLCFDFETRVMFQQFLRWVPATTRFTWVRDYLDI